MDRLEAHLGKDSRFDSQLKTELPAFWLPFIKEDTPINRMDKIWWNEQWMGYPIGPEYESNSNVTLAKNLRGKLFLIVGEMDNNVDPASTMQVVDALIKADKDFDLLVIPGNGHGAGDSKYGRRRQADFFVRHLLGIEPRGQSR